MYKTGCESDCPECEVLVVCCRRCRKMDFGESMERLSVKELRKSFFSGKKEKYVQAVDNVSFCLNQGEFLGIVGESGSGKSTVAKIIMGLIPADEGAVWVNGEPVKYPYARSVYKKLQIVFQMPQDSFDPRRTIRQCLKTTLKNFGISGSEAKLRAEELLLQMGLPVEYLDKYPHELSGGECQRAALARAMAMRPQILVCDEVTSALDVSVQAQIVDLLLKLKEEGEISMIFISHDLALVQGICDKIIVMKDGRIEEAGDTEQVLSHPSNDYTKLLIDSVLS